MYGAAFAAAFICVCDRRWRHCDDVHAWPQPQIEPRVAVETPVLEGGTMIKALSELAQDHPLMAVACAAILGATNGGETQSADGNIQLEPIRAWNLEPSLRRALSICGRR